MKTRQQLSDIAYQAKVKEMIQIANRDSLTETQRIDLLLETHWKRIWSFCFASKQEAKTMMSFDQLRPLLPYYKKALEANDHVITYSQIQTRRKQLETHRNKEKDDKIYHLFLTFENVFPMACFIEKQDANLQETTESSLYKAFLVQAYFQKKLEVDQFQQLSPLFLWQAFQLLYQVTKHLHNSPKRTSLRDTYQQLANELMQGSTCSKQELFVSLFQHGAKDLPETVVQLASDRLNKLNTEEKNKAWKAMLLQGPCVSKHAQYRTYIEEHGLDRTFLKQQIQTLRSDDHNSCLFETLTKYEAVYPLARELGKHASKLSETHYQRAIFLHEFYGFMPLSDPELYWRGFQHAFYASDIVNELYVKSQKQKLAEKEAERKKLRDSICEDQSFRSTDDKLHAYLTNLYSTYFQTEFQSADELIQRIEKHIPMAQQLVKQLGVPSASYPRTMKQLKQRLQKAEKLEISNPKKKIEKEKAMTDIVVFPIAKKLAQKEVQLRHLKEAKILMELYGTENALSFDQPRKKLTLVLEIIRFHRTLSTSKTTKKQLTGLKQAQTNYHYIPNSVKKI